MNTSTAVPNIIFWNTGNEIEAIVYHDDTSESDYDTLAYITRDRRVLFCDENLSHEVKKRIKAFAVSDAQGQH